MTREGLVKSKMAEDVALPDPTKPIRTQFSSDFDFIGGRRYSANRVRNKLAQPFHYMYTQKRSCPCIINDMRHVSVSVKERSERGAKQVV